MNSTPRRVQGPGFELVGLDGDRGHHTAIWLPPASLCRGEGLTVPEGARPFLERPGIAGLARLVALDRENQAAVYASGEVWSIAEVAASLRRRGQIPGKRAGVELAWRVADLLTQAERDASGFGLRGHGSIDPWRLGLRKDGQVVLLGYGLGTGRPHKNCEGPELQEALRYAPPERLEGLPEDGSSDVFSLALVALEWMLGEPVYAGRPEVIHRQALEAEGDRRLYGWRDRLVPDVVDVFSRVVQRDIDARAGGPAAFRDAVRRLFSHPSLDGPSLHQLVSSQLLDPPRRFVGLSEERGTADSGDPIEEVVPEVGPGRRFVSLGGRAGTAARKEAERRRAEEPAVGDAPVRRDAAWTGATPRTPWPAEALSSAPGSTQAGAAPSPGADAPVMVSPAIPVAPFAAAAAPLSPVEVVAVAPAPLAPAPVGGAPVVPAPPAPPPVPPPPAPVAPEPVAPMPVPIAPEPRAPVAPPPFVAPPVMPAPIAPAPPEPDPAVVEVVAEPVSELRPPSRPARMSVAAKGRTADAEEATEAGVPISDLHLELKERWQGDDEPTRVFRRSGEIVRLELREPDGRTFQQALQGSLRAAEAVEAVARARGLPRTDLLGATVFGWRFARDGQPYADHVRVSEIGGATPVDLMRIGNRPVLVHVCARDAEGEVWLTSAVGTAVPTSRIIAWVVQVLGLEPGAWSLTVNGRLMLPDALLEGNVADGDVLELGT